jgi:hypothetical protein
MKMTGGKWWRWFEGDVRDGWRLSDGEAGNGWRELV